MFTTQQLRAVRHKEGAALVLACPGSGKTKVITGRVSFLQKEMGVPPDRILVVTFAKDAALHMRKRYLENTGDLNTGVTFSTIHSLCYTILNQSSRFRDYRLISDTEKKHIFENILRKFKTEKDSSDRMTLSGMRGISMDISRYKCLHTGGSCYEEYMPKDTDAETFRFFYQQYSGTLMKMDLYDFDDMTGMAMESLINEKSPMIIKIKDRFLYILIDEFQDTSVAQFEMLKYMSKNLFTVGDDDQSIYNFRGGNPDIINIFKDSFPDHSLYKLSDNFRSTKQIVEAASSVISENKYRQDKKCFPAGRHIISVNDSFRLEEFTDRHDEAMGIVRFLNETVYGSKKTFAILTRTNEEAVFLAAVLQNCGKRYFLKGCSGSVFEHPAINVFISYFRVALGIGSVNDFINIFRNPVSELPSSCFYGATDQSDCWERALKFAGDDTGLQTGILLIKEKTEYMKCMPPSEAVIFAGKALFLDDWFLKKYDNTVVYKERIHDFRELLKGFSSIDAFLSYEKKYTKLLNENKSNIKRNDGIEMINIMTMHASKGLEFDAVWIPGVNEGNIPFSKSVKSGDIKDIEEERRLFYVGMTRASEVLRISCRKTGAAGRGTPSRFLKILS